MHGGVGRDAVQPEQLIQPQAQQILKARFLLAARGLASDQPIQRGLPPDDAGDEFECEAAISGGKFGGGKRALQQRLSVVVAVRAASEYACRNFSWFLAVHFV